MRAAILLAAMAGLAAGQSKTTVQEAAMRDARGSLLGGSLSIRAAAAFTAPDGSRIDTSWAEVPVVNGQFSIPLWPGTYTVKWSLTNQPARTENWLVYASSTPLTTQQVITGTVTPGSYVQWSQIIWPSLAAGTYCVTLPAGTLTACSGSGPQSWGALTSSNWSGMTSSIWSGLVR